jgi:putative ABC transport system permease protein
VVRCAMKWLSCMNRKLIRDILHYRGQVAAIALVVACGVAQFLTNRVSYDAIRNTQAKYYIESRFADVFAFLKRAPLPVATRIGAIPGVLIAESRIVMDVTLDVPGLGEPARARLVSVPDQRQPELNRIRLRRGRYIAAGHNDEILASEAFANTNQLQPGSMIEAVINGRWRRLQSSASFCRPNTFMKFSLAAYSRTIDVLACCGWAVSLIYSVRHERCVQ